MNHHLINVSEKMLEFYWDFDIKIYQFLYTSIIKQWHLFVNMNIKVNHSPSRKKFVLLNKKYQLF